MVTRKSEWDGIPFLTHVKVPLSTGVKRLQFSCTSPQNTGIIIDDLRIARFLTIRKNPKRTECEIYETSGTTTGPRGSSYPRSYPRQCNRREGNESKYCKGQETAHAKRQALHGLGQAYAWKQQEKLRNWV